MEVAYSQAKSASNLQKHGVSLARASAFHLESALVEVDDREDYGEARYFAIGFLEGNLHSLVFTLRNGGIRAISLRRSNTQERKRYAIEN